MTRDTPRAPRALLSADEDLAALCAQYARQLEDCGQTRLRPDADVFRRLPDGREIDDVMRRAVRSALREGDAIPFDPFGADSAAVVEWLTQPDPRSGDPRLSRYLRALWGSDAGLRNRFPDIDGEHAAPFLSWVRSHAAAGGAVPTDMLPPTPSARPAVARPTAHGVNLVGYLRSGFGIGEATRLIARGLQASGLPSTAVLAKGVSVEHEVDFAQGDNVPIYDVNLICVNVDWISRFVDAVGADFFRGRRNIAVWWWESDILPEHLAKNDAIFDEIWVGSRFVRDILVRHTDRPVRVIPVPAPDPPSGDLPSREQLGLPDGFIFLTIFDFNSTAERKNPEGILSAFMKAFADGAGPTLVLKGVNGHLHVGDLERLRFLARGRSDVRIVDEYVSRAERDGYLAECDCYVSLHRSEGLGLPLAEAMALGKPVVATGFSGNLDFMTEENSFLIPHGAFVLQRPSGPYPAGTTWAEPDLDAAASAMRRVYDAPAAAIARGRRGQADVRRTLSVEACAAFIRERLAELPPPEPAHETGDGALPLPDPAREALRFVAVGPAPVTLGSSKGAAGRLAKRAVLAATKPARTVQAEFNASIAAGLEQTVSAASARFDEMRRQAEEMERRIGELEGTTASTERRVQTLSNRFTILDEELHARPYVSDPDVLLTRDDTGHPAIGNRGGDPRKAEGRDLYLGFENVFRGSEERIARLQAPYVEMLAANPPVLDVGCGRGEMLDLLRARGVAAIGVDSDEGMVSRCRAKGHRVELADGVEFLRGQPDDSYGAVFAAQVIEHVPYPQLLDLLGQVGRVLRPGGRAVLETVNPHSVQAFKAFWLDLTHVSPIYPEVAVTLARLSGFREAWIVFPEATGDLERDRRNCPAYAVVAVADGDGSPGPSRVIDVA